MPSIDPVTSARSGTPSPNNISNVQQTVHFDVIRETPSWWTSSAVGLIWVILNINGNLVNSFEIPFHIQNEAKLRISIPDSAPVNVATVNVIVERKRSRRALSRTIPRLFRRGPAGRRRSGGVGGVPRHQLDG